MSKKEISNEIQNRLEEFHVEVPEIPMKKSKLERIANWIYAPATNPLEMFNIRGNSLTRLVFYPFIFILVLLLTPAIFI